MLAATVLRPRSATRFVEHYNNPKGQTQSFWAAAKSLLPCGFVFVYAISQAVQLRHQTRLHKRYNRALKLVDSGTKLLHKQSKTFVLANNQVENQYENLVITDTEMDTIRARSRKNPEDLITLQPTWFDRLITMLTFF